MRIETTSSLNTFSTCARKYKHAYIDRLQSPSYSSALGLGTFVHAFAETLKPGGNLAAADQAVQAELNKYKNQQSDVYEETCLQIADDFEFARALTPIWWKHWNDRSDYLSNEVLQFKETEKEWSFKVNDDAMLVGKRDGILFHETFQKNFLHEIKTSGDNDRDTYKHKLQMERQISNNVQAIRQEGRQCDGVLYDIIWKPRLIRGINRKTKPDETLEEFRARKIADVKERPEHYFERILVYRSERDMKQAMENVVNQFGMLAAGASFGYPRNEAACENWGRLCPYFTQCMDGEQPQGFIERDVKFPEISSEFQKGLTNE